MERLKMNPTMWAGWIYCHLTYNSEEKEEHDKAVKLMMAAMEKETLRPPVPKTERSKTGVVIDYHCPQCGAFLCKSVCGSHYMEGESRCPLCGQRVNWSFT
jgi:predicted SprT family Zn-dependent metalloprotease